jgi:hypothetical protein
VKNQLDGARERSRIRSPRSENALELKLFKDLIAPALGAVTGFKGLAALPGSAANPYNQPAPAPAPVYRGPDVFAGVMPGGAQMTPAIFGGLPGILRGGAQIGRGLIAGGAAGAAVRYGGRIMTAAGKWITRKKVVAVAKQIGIQAAATALGLGVLEIAEMIVEEETRKRRGGGVTAAQLRTTRKTMRRVMGMARTIRASCSETGFISRRRSSSRAACPAPRVIVTKR